MDSEARAVVWQWVIGVGIIVLAAAAALYTPSMPETSPPAEPAGGPVPRLSQVLPVAGFGPVTSDPQRVKLGSERG